MGNPNRIAIATGGYRCGGTPVKTSIATHGYRCLEPAPLGDPFGGGMGHGAVILDPPLPGERPKRNAAELAALAIIAIEEVYE